MGKRENGERAKGKKEFFLVFFPLFPFRLFASAQVHSEYGGKHE
jgi:hypothetical protein